jgi:hypothetical protein
MLVLKNENGDRSYLMSTKEPEGEFIEGREGVKEKPSGPTEEVLESPHRKKSTEIQAEKQIEVQAVEKKSVSDVETLSFPIKKTGDEQKALSGIEKASRPVSKTDIIQTARKLWSGVEIRGKATHRMKENTAAWYNGFLALIRLKSPRDWDMLTHELGHHFDREMQRWSKQKGLPTGIPSELVVLGRALYGDKKPKGGYRSEGFAEFIRYYLASNPDIETKAPNLYNWFTTQYLVENPKEAERIHDLGLLITQRIAQTGEENIEAFMAKNKQDWSPQRIAAVMASLEAQHIDKILPIFRVMQKAGVEGLDPDENPFMMGTAYARSGGGRAADSALENVINLDGDIVGPGLVTALDPVAKKGPKEVKNWKKYAISARVIEKIKQGFETGVSLEDAQEVFEKYDSKEFRKVTDAVTEWSHNVLHLLVDAGKITEQEFKDIVRLNPVYLPFMRQFIEGEKRKGLKPGKGGKGVYRFKGDDREIEDVLDMLVVQAESIWRVAMQTDVVRALYRVAHMSNKDGSPMYPGLGKIMKNVPAPIEATTFTAEQIKKEMAAKAVELGADPDEVGAAMLDVWEEKMTVFSRGTQYKGSDNIVSLVIDGKQQFVEINDIGVLEAIGEVVRERFLPGTVGEISRRIVGLQRLGATGLNPAFSLIRNLLRDALTGFITADYHYPIPAISAIWGAIKAIRGVESSKLFNALGLNYATRIQQDKYLMKRPGRRVTARTPLGKFWTAGVISGIRDILSYSEIGPRLLEFEGATRYAKKQKGRDGNPWSQKSINILASCASKDITVNFTRSGSVGAKINEVVLFYNAGIQGVNKLGRSMGAFEAMPWQKYQTRGANLRKTVGRGSLLTLAALALYTANKGEEWWEELPPYEKWNYLHVGLDGKLIARIPLPFEAGALFGSLPVALVDGKQSFDEALEQALKNAIPFSVEGESIQEVGHSLMRNIAAIGPLADVVANRDWKGDYIVFPGTRDLPTELEHMLNGYLGGLYRRLAAALKPSTYIKAGEGGDLSTIPIAGTLFLRPTTSRLTDDFFKKIESLGYKKDSGDANLEEIGWLSAGSSLRRKLGDLWDARRKTESRTEKTRIMDDIYSKIRKFNARKDLKQVGSYRVIIAATDKTATEIEKATARRLLVEYDNLSKLLHIAAKKQGWNTKSRTSTFKLTPFGERLQRLRNLEIK